MTKDEIGKEWQYRYQERLGILCEDQDPTPEQRKIARDEATEAIKIIQADERSRQA